jgi:hypothetical protein
LLPWLTRQPKCGTWTRTAVRRHKNRWFALHAVGNLRPRHEPGDETTPVLRPQGLCHGGPAAEDPNRVAPLALAMQRTALQLRGTSCHAAVKKSPVGRCRARARPATGEPCEGRSVTGLMALTGFPRTRALLPDVPMMTVTNAGRVFGPAHGREWLGRISHLRHKGARHRATPRPGLLWRPGTGPDGSGGLQRRNRPPLGAKPRSRPLGRAELDRNS